MDEHMDSMIQRTEAMLYDYPRQKNALLNEIAERNEIQKHGLFTGSANPSDVFQKNHRVDRASEYERQEEVIHKLNRLIKQAKDKVDKVEQVLDLVKDDPFYDLIRLKYFEVRTDAEIGRHFKISVASVRDQKNRIVGRMAGQVFGEEYLNTVLGWLM